MALAFESEIEIIEVMEAYLIHSRPAEEFRPQVDLNYKIEGQSVIVVEIRPVWNNPSLKRESNIAKASFVKTENVWKIYWFRSDMKWHVYEPNAKVSRLKEFVRIIVEDEFSCFWG